MEVLLRKATLKIYNINACKENLDKILTGYISAKYTYIGIIRQGEQYYNSSCNINYEYKPEFMTIKYNDRVGKKVEFKIDNEIEARQIADDIQTLYKRFTIQEKDYFDCVLLDRQPQRIIEDKYRITKTGLEPIKRSCIVKAALFFNVAIRR